MFKGRFTRIKDISERRRLPRLGKIKLGVKIASDRSRVEYPRETDYFVVPPEVAKVYGERPRALDVMLPINDPEVVFPQAYKWYGSNRGLKCVGDGEVALRLDSNAMCEVACPCELLDKECQKVGHLMVILPRVNMGGVYQIDVGSYHSIVDVNSGLDYVQALVGRFAMVPLRLVRVPKETHFGGQKQIHYTLQLFLDADVELLNTLRENTSRVLLSTQNLALPPVDDLDEMEAELKGENGNAAKKDGRTEKSEGGDTDKTSADRTVESQAEARNEKGNLGCSEAADEEKDSKITRAQIDVIKKIAAKRGLRLNYEIIKTLSYRTAGILIREMQKEDFAWDKIYGQLNPVSREELPY